MKTLTEQLNYLKTFVTDERNALFQNKIKDRTDYLTIVLEDVFQSHNQAAVLRSADCFGVQDVHVIEKKNAFDGTSTISRGAADWLTIKSYADTASSVKSLRDKGYRIVATSPHAEDVDLENLDLNKGKIALFFGTEWKGLSGELLQSADEYVKIPMCGFTESLNVSVCAAICIYSLTLRLRNSGIDWHISQEKMQEVLYVWYMNSVRSSDQIMSLFNK